LKPYYFTFRLNIPESVYIIPLLFQKCVRAIASWKTPENLTIDILDRILHTGLTKTA